MDGIVVIGRCMRDENGLISAKDKVPCARYQFLSQTFKDLDKNEFNNFLHLYHSRLIDYLMEFFCLNKSGIECFLFDEFSYSGCDWYTGQQ